MKVAGGTEFLDFIKREQIFAKMLTLKDLVKMQDGILLEL